MSHTQCLYPVSFVRRGNGVEQSEEKDKENKSFRKWRRIQIKARFNSSEHFGYMLSSGSHVRHLHGKCVVRKINLPSKSQDSGGEDELRN